MKRLLLAGAGHAHVHVLDAIARAPLRDDAGAPVEVTLLSPFDRQVYSGMLPGWMAGHYTLEQCVIPLAGLVERAGVRFVQAHLARLDPVRRLAWTEAGEEIAFDVLSIDTGPVMGRERIPGAREHGIPIRPIEGFIQMWMRLHAQWSANSLHGGERPTLTVVGGGAAGLEIALAIAWRVRCSQVPVRIQLIAGHAGVVPELSRRFSGLLENRLIRAGVRVIHDDVGCVERASVHMTDGSVLPSETTIIAIGADAAEWPRAAGLAVDGRGFIGINPCLQSLSHPFVFAAGDCASMIDHPRPRSGVFAVRAGPPLEANLRRALAGQPLKPWVPQKRALYLLAAGPQSAIASWNGLSAEGRWVWRWKDRIDRQFMARYARPPGTP